MLYVAATRAKRYLCFVGENVELKDYEKLDSFVKMLKGALGRQEVVLEGVTGNYAGEQIKSRFGDGVNKNTEASPDNGIVKDILKRIRFMPDYKIKSSFSISRYFTYTGCLRKFFYIYRAGLESAHFEKTGGSLQTSLYPLQPGI